MGQFVYDLAVTFMGRYKIMGPYKPPVQKTHRSTNFCFFLF